MADDTHETCQITRVESHCVNYSPYESLAVDFASNLARFLQFADDTINTGGHNLRHMQLLGACPHNFLLFRVAITHGLALLQS